MDEEKQSNGVAGASVNNGDEFPLSLMLESVGIVLTAEEEQRLYTEYYYLYETYSEAEQHAIETAIEKADERASALQQAKINSFAESAALDAAKAFAEEELNALNALLALEREHDLKPMTVGRTSSELNRRLATAKGEVDHAAVELVQAKTHAEKDMHLGHDAKTHAAALAEKLKSVEAIIENVRSDSFPDGGRPVRAAQRELNKAHAAAQVAGMEKEAAEQEANEYAKKCETAEKMAAASAHAREKEETCAKKAGKITASRNEKADLGVSLMAAITHCNAQRDALQAATRFAEAQSHAAKESRDHAEKECQHLAAALSKAETVALMHSKLKADEESEALVETKGNAEDAGVLFDDIQTLINRDNLALDIATDGLVHDAEALVERGDDDIDGFEQYRIATDTVAEEEAKALAAKKKKDAAEAVAKAAEEARKEEEKYAQDAEMQRQAAELNASEAAQRGDVEGEVRALEEAKHHADESKEALAAAREYAEEEHRALLAAKEYADVEAEALTKAREAAESARELIAVVLAAPPLHHRTSMGAVVLGNGDGLFEGVRRKPRKKPWLRAKRDKDSSRFRRAGNAADLIAADTSSHLSAQGFGDDGSDDSSGAAKNFSSVHEANPKKVALRLSRERAAEAQRSIDEAKKRAETAKTAFQQQNDLANKENDGFQRSKRKNEAMESKVRTEFGDDKVAAAADFGEFQKSVDAMKLNEEKAAAARVAKDANIEETQQLENDRKEKAEAAAAAAEKRREVDELLKSLASSSPRDKVAEGVALDDAKKFTDAEAVALMEAAMIANKENSRWQTALEHATEETVASTAGQRDADEAGHHLGLVRGSLLGSYKDALDAGKRDVAEAEQAYVDTKAAAEDMSAAVAASIGRNDIQEHDSTGGTTSKKSTPRAGVKKTEPANTSTNTVDPKFSAYKEASKRAAGLVEEAKATRQGQRSAKERAKKLRTERETREKAANGLGTKRLQAEEFARRAAARGDKEKEAKAHTEADKYAEDEGSALKAAAELTHAEVEAWREAHALGEEENDLLKRARDAAADAAIVLADMQSARLQKLRNELQQAQDAAAAAGSKGDDSAAAAKAAVAARIDVDATVPQGAEKTADAKEFRATLKECGAIEEKLNSALADLAAEEKKAAELHSGCENSNVSANDAEEKRAVAEQALASAIATNDIAAQQNAFDQEHGFTAGQQTALALAIEQAKEEVACWGRVDGKAAAVQQLADALHDSQARACFQRGNIELQQERKHLADARAAAAAAEAAFKKVDGKVDKENQELAKTRELNAKYEAELPDAFKSTPAYQEYVMASQSAAKEERALKNRTEKNIIVPVAMEAKNVSMEREKEADSAADNRRKLAAGEAVENLPGVAEDKMTKNERIAMLGIDATTALQAAAKAATEETEAWKKSAALADQELVAVTATNTRLMSVLRSGLVDKYKDALQKNKSDAEEAEKQYKDTRYQADAIAATAAAELLRNKEKEKDALSGSSSAGDGDAATTAAAASIEDEIDPKSASYFNASKSCAEFTEEAKALQKEQLDAGAKARDLRVQREQHEDIAKGFAEKRAAAEEAVAIAVEAGDVAAEEAARTNAQRLAEAEADALKEAANLALAEQSAWHETKALAQKEKDLMTRARSAAAQAASLLFDMQLSQLQTLRDALSNAQAAADVQQERRKSLEGSKNAAEKVHRDFDASPATASDDSPEYEQYRKVLRELKATQEALAIELDSVKSDDAAAASHHTACDEEKAKASEADERMLAAAAELAAAVAAEHRDVELTAFAAEQSGVAEEKAALLRAKQHAVEEEAAWKSALAHAEQARELSVVLQQGEKNAKRTLVDVELTRERRFLDEAKAAATSAEAAYNCVNDRIDKENKALKDCRARNADHEAELPQSYKETPAFQNYIVASQATVKDAKAIEKRQEKASAVPKAMQAKQNCAREKRNADAVAARRAKRFGTISVTATSAGTPSVEEAAPVAMADSALTSAGNEEEEERQLQQLSEAEQKSLQEATKFAKEEETAWKRAAFLAQKEMEAVAAAIMRAEEAAKLLEALRKDRKENDRNALALGITLAEEAEKQFVKVQKEVKEENKSLAQVKARNEKLEICLNTETKESMPEFADFKTTQQQAEEAEGRAAAARASKENEVAQATEARKKRREKEEEADDAENARQKALAAASTAAARGDKKGEAEALARAREAEELTEKSLKSAADFANDEADNWSNAASYAEEEKEALNDAHDTTDNAMLLLAMIQAAQKERSMLDCFNTAKEAAEAAKEAYMEVDDAIRAEDRAVKELQEQNSKGEEQLSEATKSGINYERYKHALTALQAAMNSASHAEVPKAKKVTEAEEANLAGEKQLEKATNASENIKAVLVDTKSGAGLDSSMRAALEAGADREDVDFADVYGKSLSKPKSSFNLGRHIDADYVDVDDDDEEIDVPSPLPSPAVTHSSATAATAIAAAAAVAFAAAKTATTTSSSTATSHTLTRKASLARIQSILSMYGSMADINSNISDLGSTDSDPARTRAAQLHAQLRAADAEALRAETILAEVEETALAAAADFAAHESDAWKAALPLALRQRKQLTDAHEHAMQAARLLAVMLSGDHDKENKMKLMTSLEAAESAARRFQEADENTRRAADSLATTRGKENSLAGHLDEESKKTPEYEDFAAILERMEEEKVRYDAARSKKEANVAAAMALKAAREELQKSADRAKAERQAADKAATSLASSGNTGAENAVLAQSKHWSTEEDKALKAVMQKLSEESEAWKVATQYSADEKDCYLAAEDIAQSGMLLLAVLKATQDERILFCALSDANGAADDAKAAYEESNRCTEDKVKNLEQEKQPLTVGEKLPADSKNSSEYKQYLLALQQCADAEKKANDLRQQKNVQALTAASAREQRDAEEAIAVEAGEKMRNVLVDAEEEETAKTAKTASSRKSLALVDFGSVYENPNATPIRSPAQQQQQRRRQSLSASRDAADVTPSGRSATRLGRVHGILADIGAEENGEFYRNLPRLGRSGSGDAAADSEVDSPFRDALSPGSQEQEERAALRVAEKKALDAEKKWADIQEKKLKSAVAYAGIECTAWIAAKPLADGEAAALDEAREHARDAVRLLSALLGNAETAALQAEKNEAERLHQSLLEKQSLTSEKAAAFTALADHCTAERESLEALKQRLDDKGSRLEHRGIGFEEEIDEYHKARGQTDDKEARAEEYRSSKDDEASKALLAHGDLERLLRDNGDEDNRMICPEFGRYFPTIIINSIEYTKPAAARRRRLAAELTSEHAADADDIALLTKALQEAKKWTEEEEKANKVLSDTKIMFFEDSSVDGNSESTITINGTTYWKPAVIRAKMAAAEDAGAAARLIDSAVDGSSKNVKKAEAEAQHWIDLLGSAKEAIDGLEQVLGEQPEDEDYTQIDWDARYPNVLFDNSPLLRPSVARRRSAASESIADDAIHEDAELSSAAMHDARFWQRENARALRAAVATTGEESRAYSAAQEKADEELKSLTAARIIGEEEERKLDAIFGCAPYRSSMSTVCLGGGAGLFPGEKVKPFEKSRNNNNNNDKKQLIEGKLDRNKAATLPHVASSRDIDIGTHQLASEFNSCELNDDGSKESQLLYEEADGSMLKELQALCQKKGPYRASAVSLMPTATAVATAVLLSLSGSDAALLKEQMRNNERRPNVLRSPPIGDVSKDIAKIITSLATSAEVADHQQKLLDERTATAVASNNEQEDMTEFDANLDLHQQSRVFLSGIDKIDCDLSFDSSRVGDMETDHYNRLNMNTTAADVAGSYCDDDRRLMNQIAYYAYSQKPYVSKVTTAGTNALAFPLSGSSGVEDFPRTPAAVVRLPRVHKHTNYRPLVTTTTAAAAVPMPVVARVPRSSTAAPAAAEQKSPAGREQNPFTAAMSSSLRTGTLRTTSSAAGVGPMRPTPATTTALSSPGAAVASPGSRSASPRPASNAADTSSQSTVKHHGSVPDTQDNPIGSISNSSPRTRNPRPGYAPRSVSSAASTSTTTATAVVNRSPHLEGGGGVSASGDGSRAGSPRPLQQALLSRPSMERMEAADDSSVGSHRRSSSSADHIISSYSPMESPPRKILIRTSMDNNNNNNNGSGSKPPLAGASSMRLSNSFINRANQPKESVRDKTEQEQAQDAEKRQSRGAAFLTQKPSSLLKSRSIAQRHSLARTQSSTGAEFGMDSKKSSSVAPVTNRDRPQRMLSKYSPHSQSQRIPSTEAMDLYGIQDDASVGSASIGGASRYSAASGTAQSSQKRLKKKSSFTSDSEMIQEMVSGNIKL